MDFDTACNRLRLLGHVCEQQEITASCCLDIRATVIVARNPEAVLKFDARSILRDERVVARLWVPPYRPSQISLLKRIDGAMQFGGHPKIEVAVGIALV